jgi:hypothetical protein
VDLEPLLAEFEEASGKPSSKSCKCKEKFGGLRIHVNHCD